MVIQVFGCSFRLQRSYDTPIAVASGRLGGEATRQIKSLDGYVFFQLSYFDCSDLQLFAIFIFEVYFAIIHLDNLNFPLFNYTADRLA